jgi:hypothetical protein
MSGVLVMPETPHEYWLPGHYFHVKSTRHDLPLKGVATTILSPMPGFPGNGIALA